MDIAIALFEQVTALDAIGPYEVLQRVPGSQLKFVGHRKGEIRTDNGFLGLTVDHTFDEVPRPDVILVPGGIGTRALIHDDTILSWIRTAHETSQYTTSVCTGSLLLAAAGLLGGLDATTHFSARPILTKLGATPVDDRVVHQGKIITAAGVSSGIDMALALVERLTDSTTAQAIQLMIEYDPHPPHDTGALEKATPEILARGQHLATLRH
ncbi:MAG: DJ-1/PfpI family protein [Polyangiales bacterium]